MLQLRAMHDELARNLPERTGKHICTKCLAEVPAAEYFRNEQLCDVCANEDEYPLASTPDARQTSDAKPDGKRTRDARRQGPDAPDGGRETR